MKLFKKAPVVPPTARQRLRQSYAEPVVRSNRTTSRRPEVGANTGRKAVFDLQPALTGFAKFWAQRFGVLILLVVAIASLIEISSLSTTPTVQLASGSPAHLLQPAATYSAVASKLLASNTLYHNKVTFDTQHFDTQLLAQLPDVSSVTTALPLLTHRPIIYLAPVTPAAVIFDNTGSYVLGSNGVIIAPNNGAVSIDTVKLPTITDQSDEKLTLGKQVVTAGDINFIQTIISELASKQVTVTSLSLPAATRELDVHVAGQNYLVKFNLQSGTARQQAGTFLAVQARLAGQHITPAQYIDVRVDGRAYYL